MTERPYRPAILALALYVVLLCWILLNPSAEVPSDGVAFVTRGGEALGLPKAITTRTEFIANVAIFVPLPVLGTAVLGRLPVLSWTGLALAVSLAVEVTQRSVLTSRSGSTDDVVANTLGAFIGAVLAWLLVRRDRWPGRHDPS